jgi:predicted N-formylglutamate amidohydrolase
VLVTCEHGGNRIPARYRPLFNRHPAVLQTHRGYDVGALAFARDLAAALDAKLVYSTTSRLLVELNRSPGHRSLFSEMTRDLSPGEREAIMARYYLPYRRHVENEIALAVAAGRRVVHISSHSFAPVLGGVVRRADIGLLYDPHRACETRFCRTWQRHIAAAAHDLSVRRNYPYRGSDDGLTTWLRTRFRADRYLGIELEINQKYPRGDARRWRELRNLLVATFTRSVENAFEVYGA